jgi:hypothetical protein
MNFKPLLAAAALAPALALVPAAGPQAIAAPKAAASHHHGHGGHHKHCTYPPKKSKLTLSLTKFNVHKGQKTTAFGTLSEAHCRVKGGHIHLLANGKQIAQKATKGNGSYRITFAPKKTEKLQAVYTGKSHDSDPAASHTVTVHVSKKHHHKKHHHKKHHHKKHHK